MRSYNWGINGRPLVHAGATVTVDELRAYLKARVARYEMPRDLVVVDHIPRNPTGKLQRAELPVAPDPRRVGGG